jgi:hypothetical protein
VVGEVVVSCLVSVEVVEVVEILVVVRVVVLFKDVFTLELLVYGPSPWEATDGISIKEIKEEKATMATKKTTKKRETCFCLAINVMLWIDLVGSNT